MTLSGDSRSANALKRHRRLLAFLLISGMVLGLFGPYGTYQALATPQRVAFWILSVAAIGGATVVIRRLAAHFLERRLGFWPVLAGACLASTVVGTTMLGLALPLILPAGTTMISVAALFGQVLLVTLCLTGLGLVLERRAMPDSQVAAGAPAPRETTSLWRQRLPAPLRDAELLALEAEDHYLRVHTAAGSTLILMRLSDAVAELGADAGAQVHRSFWIARGAVERIERGEGRVTVVLRGGLKVPVSRAHQAKIKAFGDAG